jgi:hypothetical protein
MPDGPIFLTGVYRSGTTLVAKLLGAHPRLRVASDSLNFYRFYLGRFEPCSLRYGEIVSEARERLGERFSIEIPEERILRKLEGLETITLKEIYDVIMTETWCEGDAELRWGEKSLLQWTNIPLFLQMFPDGQAIQIIRDPRDVLASYREFTIEAPHRYLDAVFACLHAMDWAATTAKALPGERFLTVRHEEVVSDPERFAEGMCAFLGIEFDPAMLDPTKYQDNTGKQWKPNTAFADVPVSSISAETTERWRSKLESWETAFTESIIGDLMEEFGYPRSGSEFTSNDLSELWERIASTPLLQERLWHWWRTGQGVEAYPSNPLEPKNWAAGMGPKGVEV